MKIEKRKTKEVQIGSVAIGCRNPVAIQSMAKTKTSDVENTLRQINRLQEAGCEIVRLAVKDETDALALSRIKKRAKLPLVADIHFNWRLALAAIEAGVDKIRLNPGNIYKRREVQEIARAAKQAGIPIRVGLNSGSLPRAGISKTKGKNSAEIMTKSALDYIRILEKCGFHDIVVSLKASNIRDTVEAYKLMAKLCDYPFHLGVTATGPARLGAIKSSIALGVLLLEGIGDTIRVSLTDKPEEEVKTAKSILDSMGLRNFGPEIISCPTCGRCEVDLIKVVKSLESKLSERGNHKLTRPVKLAVMGCVVNGPGEAKEADIGIAFGKREGLLFKKGRPVRKVDINSCAGVLLNELGRQ